MEQGVIAGAVTCGTQGTRADLKQSHIPVVSGVISISSDSWEVPQDNLAVAIKDSYAALHTAHPSPLVIAHAKQLKNLRLLQN